MSLSFCLSLCFSLCLYLFICLSLCLCLCLSHALSLYLYEISRSLSRFLSLSLSLYIYIYISLSIYIYIYIHLINQKYNQSLKEHMCYRYQRLQCTNQFLYETKMICKHIFRMHHKSHLLSILTNMIRIFFFNIDAHLR